MRKAIASLTAVTLGVTLALVGTVALAARDSSGTYSLSPTSPFVTGTAISSSVMNTRFADIASELTDSASRSGKGAYLSALKLFAGGSAAVPELTWDGDTDSGFYNIGADNVGLSLGGTKRWDFAAAGSTLTGTLGVSGAVTAPSVTSGAASDLTLGAPASQSTHIQANGATGLSVLADGTNDNKSRRLVNVADPTSAQDAATKAYVDPGMWTTVVKTDANQSSTSDVTWTTITNMTFSAAANGVYVIEAWVPFTTAGGTTGVGVNWEVPTSPTNFVWNVTSWAGTLSATLRGGDGGTLSNVATDSAGLNQHRLFKFDALLVNGANAGTVSIQFASEVSGSAVTAETGATMRYRKVQ